MSSFFVPSTLQKRFLKYILTSTGFLDTDSMGLDSLDINWGKRSTLDFRDVALKQEALSSYLPPGVQCVKASLADLRITIPVDIYSSPIEIDGESLTIHLRIPSAASGKGSKGKDKLSSEQNSSTDAKSLPHDHLPSAADLAESFLQSEDSPEKAELEAALLSQSVASSEGGDESVSDVGTGPGIGLPAFMTNFVLGITDRVQVNIRDIAVKVDIEVPNESRDGKPETFTVELAVEDFTVTGVASGNEDLDADGLSLPLPLKDGKRLVTLRNLRGMLIGQGATFTALAQSSAMSSPNMTSENLQNLFDLPSQQSVPDVATEVEPSIADFLPETPHSVPSSIHQSSTASFHSLHSLDALQLSSNDLAQSIESCSRPEERPPSVEDDSEIPGSNLPSASPSPSASFHSMHSLEASPPFQDNLSKSVDSQFEDAPESMLFTHEEAQSLYQSAFSEGAHGNMPGSWGNSSAADSHDGPPPDAKYTGHADNDEVDLAASIHVPENNARDVNTNDGADDEDSVESSPQTPIARSVNMLHAATSDMSSPSSSSTTDNRLGKQLFYLDYVGLYEPAKVQPESKPADDDDEDTASSMAQSAYQTVPGAFSTPSLSSQKAKARQPSSHTSSPTPKPTVEEKTNVREIVLGQLHANFDVAVARLLYSLLQSVLPVFDTPSNSSKKDSDVMDSATEMSLRFSMHRLSLKFLEHLPGTTLSGAAYRSAKWAKSPAADVLLRTTFKGLSASFDAAGSTVSASLSLKKFVFGYAEENIMSFDGELQMRESVRDLPVSAGVDVTVGYTKNGDSSYLTVSTLPLRISIGLQKLDETFGWLGGLSTVLNMTNSIASNTTTTTSSPTKPKPRGVRFEDHYGSLSKRENAPKLPQSKLDLRIGGFMLDLIGKDCSVGLDTSPIKLIWRDGDIGGRIDKMTATGPHLGIPNSRPAIHAKIYGTSIQFRQEPTNEDLDRLLALITPSKPKYESEDDILFDTLLRQRRQGSVLRLTVDNFKLHVSQIEQLKYLPVLGEELAKLSTVAKYLPEDDRPGLMSLIHIKEASQTVEMGGAIGVFGAKLKEVQLAHVTLPVLLALSVSTIRVHRNSDEEIIVPALDISQPKHEQQAEDEQQSENEQTPMLMVRMIGDEMEPTVKVKLWNVQCEYRVPTLMAILGTDDTASTEDITVTLATSVATLLDRDNVPLLIADAPMNLKGQEARPLVVDIAIKDCALGLNPLNMPSKVMAVMTVAHISATVPVDGNTSAKVESSKMAVMVINDTNSVDRLAVPGAKKNKRYSFDGGSTLVRALDTQGYITAINHDDFTIDIHVTKDSSSGAQLVDAELRNNLIVIELCPDSTATLITSLGAVAPPTPPSAEKKYKTNLTAEEGIPVTELMKSIFEAPFEVPDGDYDFDEQFAGRIDYADLGDGSPSLSFDEDYFGKKSPKVTGKSPKESEHGSLLFNSSDQGESSESEDHVLVESFKSKQHVHIHEELDFKDDHFGAAASGIQGTAHLWNTKDGKYVTMDPEILRLSPLKLRVRGVNIIFKLFDGYDWQSTRDAIAKTTEEVQNRETAKRTSGLTVGDRDDFAEEDIGDFLFNSIWIGVRAAEEPGELGAMINRGLMYQQQDDDTVSDITMITHQTAKERPNNTAVKGKKLHLERSRHHKMTVELKDVNVDAVTFPKNSGETLSSYDIRIRDFEIIDNVRTSSWSKFACYSKAYGKRESGSNMLHLEVLDVKPTFNLAATELVLRLWVLPLALHVDHDALDFMARFFAFKDDSLPPSTGEKPFIQLADIHDIPVTLHFKPKRVDYGGIRSGKTTEYMNFINLEDARMTMKHCKLMGVQGFDRAGDMLNDLWMPDVKATQLPTVLAGLAPIRSLATIGYGMQQLITVPIQEYKKDGRVFRALSKGVRAFGKTGGVEMFKLGAKLAVGTQGILEGVEGLVGASPKTERNISSDWEGDSDDGEGPRTISAYANQPINVAAGFRTAYSELKRDILMAKDCIIAIPGEIRESGSARGAAGVVGRRAPTIVIRPVLGTTKAIAKTLMGINNQVDPDNIRRMQDKYKSH